MSKPNMYDLDKPTSKAAPHSPLERHLIERLISSIRGRSVYGNTASISTRFNLRHAIAVKVLREYCTEENGYKAYRPAKKHKVYRPIRPTFRKDGTVYWS